MDNNFKRAKRRFIKHMRKTYKTKLVIIAMILLGWWVGRVTGEGVLLVLSLAFGIPAFFSNEDFSKPYCTEED